MFGGDDRMRLIACERMLKRVLALQGQLIQEGVETMASLADVKAAVAAQKTVIDGAETLLSQLHDQLAAALAANDPVALQAIVDELGANQAGLAQAIIANTPAAPTPPPANP